MAIDAILKKNETNYCKWNDIFRSYLDLTFNRSSFNDEQSLEIIYSTDSLLSEIAKGFKEYGKFKDTWEEDHCQLDIYGQSIRLKSLKTGIYFDLGVDKNSFYLQCNLSYAENLKKMGDDFWNSYLQLSELGNFRFEENWGIGFKEEKYFNNKKSSLFQLLRNYLIKDLENIDLEEWERNYDFDLGWLIVKWEFGISWEDLIKKTCPAFKILYQLNYQLWKIYDLKSKRH